MSDKRIPVVCDIETEPDTAWLEATETEFVATLEPPANYKSPDAIEKWFRGERDKRIEKAALSPIDGRITALAVAPLWDDSEPIALVNRVSERTLITDFIVAVSSCTRCAPAILAGFNIGDFDLPFISARAAVHGVRLPAWWPDLTRRYGICLDAYEILGREGKLARWLARFGLPPKTGEGSQCSVYTDEELQGYVQNDVRVERLLLRRLAPVSPAIRETQPELTPTP